MKKLFVVFTLLVLVFMAGIYLNKRTGENYMVSEQAYRVESPYFDFDSLKSSDAENPEERFEQELRQLVNPVSGRVPAFIRQRELEFAKSNLNRTQQISGGEPLREISSTSNTDTQTSSFVSAGPFNIGGRTRGMGIDIANEDIILAGGVSGGMWRSTNAGPLGLVLRP